MGARAERGARLVGVSGTAHASGFAVRVRLGRWLPLDGVVPAGFDDEPWLLELETRCVSARANSAVDALYLFSSNLYPLVQCGTVTPSAMMEPRQRLAAFRHELAQSDEREKRRLEQQL